MRTPDKYRSGNVCGSFNIHVKEKIERLDEIKELMVPVVLCCTSGDRSDRPEEFLLQNEIECTNGASRTDLNFNELKTV